MSSTGAARRAAVPVSHAQAEASRKNGAKSRGPKTPEGKARAAQNAIKHGLRAAKHVVLPEEDGAAFEALEAALTAELAPVGALQIVLARRVAVATWRLARADRLAAGTGLGPRSPTRRPTGRAVRGAALRRRRRRPRPDPRRQRHPVVRDAPALSRRRHGRVLARAQDAQGASGRAGELGREGRRLRPRPGGAPEAAAAAAAVARAARRSCAAKRTRGWHR